MAWKHNGTERWVPAFPLLILSPLPLRRRPPPYPAAAAPPFLSPFLLLTAAMLFRSEVCNLILHVFLLDRDFLNVSDSARASFLQRLRTTRTAPINWRRNPPSNDRRPIRSSTAWISASFATNSSASVVPWLNPQPDNLREIFFNFAKAIAPSEILLYLSSTRSRFLCIFKISIDDLI